MEKIKGLVSVITPVYNAENVIERTIKSVQDQTYQNWEMILVDDCAKDNSANLIKQKALDDPRIKYYKLDQNSGAAVARNRAIQESNGQYIAFLDADDYWIPDKLQREVYWMKAMDGAFVYAATQMIDENDNKLGDYTQVPEWTNYKFLLKRTVIATSTVLLDMEKIGDFSMPLRRSGQDYATWLMLLHRVEKAYGINEPLTLYRISSKSLSSNKIKSIRQVYEIQTRDEGIPMLFAIYNTFCFCFYAFCKHYGHIFKLNTSVKKIDKSC